jgi:hypothetical protein
LFISRLNETRRADSVDTSAPSQFAPSFVVKSGSWPLLLLKRWATSTGVIVHACAGW